LKFWPWDEDEKDEIKIVLPVEIIRECQDEDHTEHTNWNVINQIRGSRWSFENKLVECPKCGKLYDLEYYDRKPYQVCGAIQIPCNDPRIISSEPITKDNVHILGRLLGLIKYTDKVVSFSTHNEIDYAIKFSNGTGICLIDGIMIPSKCIFAPETVTIEDFLNTRNIESRKRITNIIGEDRLKVLFGDSSSIIDSTIIGKSSYELRSIKTDFGNVITLRMKNPWDVDPYYLYVPPWVKTCREARAWSFYQDPTEFEFEEES
jgi:hypothetical protein